MRFYDTDGLIGMSLNVAVRASWIIDADLDPIASAYVGALLDFFVTHSPCKYQSNKPYPLTQVWGPSPWISERILKRPLDQILYGGGEPRLFNCNSKGEMEQKLIELGLDGEDFSAAEDRQWAVYTKVGSNGNGSIYMSLFYHLRNALAHARWTVVDQDYLVFEDGKANGDRTVFELSARGILRLKSLAELVDYLTSGPCKSLDIEWQILEAIRSGVNKKKRIKEQLQISDSDWRTYCQVLRRERKIIYQRGVWHLLEEDDREH